MVAVSPVLGAVSGAVIAAGLVGVSAGLRPVVRAGGRPRRRAVRLPWARLGAAALVAVVAGLVTAWPVGAAAAGLATFALPALFARRGATEQARLEGLATWVEQLRDTISAAAGINQAIAVTAPLAPEALRPAVVALAATLGEGVAMGTALRGFAAEVADPVGDAVALALLMAAERQGARLAALLSELAATARAEVAMRLRVDAARASSWTAVRGSAGVTLGTAALLVVMSRPYLAPYATFAGQVVLAGVTAILGAGLWLMVRLARPPKLPRLLGAKR